jgi:hypothetical protein
MPKAPFWWTNEWLRLCNVVLGGQRVKNFFGVFSNFFKTIRKGIHE